MAYDNEYPVITPQIKTSGGTTGASSRIGTMIYAMIGGDNNDAGIPATGGGGGGTGTPIGLLLALTHT